MDKISKPVFTLVLIVIIVAIVASFKMYSHLNVKPIDPVLARSKGDVSAKVQVIEFIDFECPACATGAQILKELFEKHPKDIRVQVKYFPLLRIHRHAMPSALYSECAARQGKFWEFHELLMPQQAKWSALVSADSEFREMAKTAGINLSELTTCLSSEQAAKSIANDQSLGESLGVASTPSYFVNNKMVVGSKSLIEELNTYFPKK